MSEQSERVGTLVIGAGPVGLATAWALHRRGEDVMVIDADDVGAATAATASTGWLTPSLSTPLPSPGIFREGVRHMFDRDGALVIRPPRSVADLRWLVGFARAARPTRYRDGVAALLDLGRDGPELFDELCADMGTTSLLAGDALRVQSDGLLAVALTDGGLSWFEGLFRELDPLGFRAAFGGAFTAMSGAQAREVEPALSPDVRQAVRLTVDRVVDPDEFVMRLAEHLRARKVAVLGNVTALGLHRRPGQGGTEWVITTPLRSIRAQRVVVAAGVATPGLLAPLHVRVPVISGLGYGVDVTEVDNRPELPLYLAEAKIGTSTFGARWRVSGTFELFGRQPAPDEIARRCRGLVAATAPYLAEPAHGPRFARPRYGHRPCTPDGLPIIGPVPGLPGLHLATGANMLGVTLACSIGERCADGVCAAADAPPRTAFTIERGRR